MSTRSVVGEIISLRDDFCKHFLNSDSTVTVKGTLGEYIHYEDGGQLKDINLSVKPIKAWEFNQAVVENITKTYFGDDTDTTNCTLAGFEDRVGWINYKLIGANPTAYTKDGSKVTFTEVFPSVDLEYVSEIGSLKENIIIKQPTDINKFVFSAKLSVGMALRLKEDGIYVVEETTGDEAFKVNLPTAEDSAGDLVVLKCGIGSTEYRGITYPTIEIMLDSPDFFTNAQYPVIIDPTTVSLSFTSKANNATFSIVVPPEATAITSAKVRFKGVAVTGSRTAGPEDSRIPQDCTYAPTGLITTTPQGTPYNAPDILIPAGATPTGTPTVHATAYYQFADGTYLTGCTGGGSADYESYRNTPSHNTQYASLGGTETWSAIGSIVNPNLSDPSQSHVDVGLWKPTFPVESITYNTGHILSKLCVQLIFSTAWRMDTQNPKLLTATGTQLATYTGTLLNNAYSPVWYDFALGLGTNNFKVSYKYDTCKGTLEVEYTYSISKQNIKIATSPGAANWVSIIESRYWDGSTWVKVPEKRWSGTAWEDIP